MYKTGDFVVHPGQGVCKVTEVTDGPQALYKLLPLGNRHSLVITLPVEFEDRLRPVLSRQEAQDLIDSYPELEVDDYTDRNNSLEEEHYKNEIKNGTCLDTLRIAKTFRRRIRLANEENKKAPVVYERILKQASERSLSELAVALDTTPEDVAERFRTRMGDAEA